MKYKLLPARLATFVEMNETDPSARVFFAASADMFDLVQTTSTAETREGHLAQMRMWKRYTKWSTAAVAYFDELLNGGKEQEAALVREWMEKILSAAAARMAPEVREAFLTQIEK